MQKRINLAQVMRTIRQLHPLSRADVARHTGLTKSTVSNLVRDLIQRGLITETTGAGARAAGRPPILLDIAGSPWVAGVELRPDRVRLVRVSLTGSVGTREEQTLLAAASGERVAATAGERLAATAGERLAVTGDTGTALEAAWRTAQGMLDLRIDADCLGVSVAVPATVNPVTGEILESEEFGAGAGMLRYGGSAELPLAVENDANAVAWAVIRDHAEGDGRTGNALVVMGRRRPDGRSMRVGTGLVIERRVYYGTRFNAGEFRSYRWRADHDGELSTPADADLLGRAAGIELLESLAVAVSMLRPDVIVLAGDLAGEGDRLGQLIREELSGSAIDPAVSGVVFVDALDAGWSVARGAAHMFLEHLYAVPSADRVRPVSVPYWDVTGIGTRSS